MKIGADELILWLRKNQKAAGVSNDKIGNDISDLIQKKLNGKIIKEDEPAYWQATAGSKNIAPDNLPQTATQYEINPNMLPDLVKAIDRW
jgi:hypothetical protein